MRTTQSDLSRRDTAIRPIRMKLDLVTHNDQNIHQSPSLQHKISSEIIQNDTRGLPCYADQPTRLNLTTNRDEGRESLVPSASCSCRYQIHIIVELMVDAVMAAL